MKNSLRFIASTTALSAILAYTFFATIHAQTPPITDDQIARIRSSCVSVKNTLVQIHASDALLRVNRGQIYESMSTKLMGRFNDRLDNNKLDASALVSITQSYISTLATFRLDYQSYEEQLSTALGIDCSKEPVSFYDAAATAREKRHQVHADVVKLHKYIDDYANAFLLFESKFNQIGEKK